eukprot:TRINITY_DN4164_c0_g1_i10.p1 TRINITY_DN4164_c0_g1~~TRINITY_DN4164_c0_g1_i10.p1  ORF type:complete len:169 (-),score=30.43 TRINITY_DN4164_c0_g1_i10:366-872(-)
MSKTSIPPKETRLTYGLMLEKDVVKEGYLKYCSFSSKGFVWASLLAFSDYLILYTNNPRHGIDVSRRIGTILLEGSKVKVVSMTATGIPTPCLHLVLTSKSGKDFVFRGRTGAELELWKEAIIRAQKQPTFNALVTKWTQKQPQPDLQKEPPQDIGDKEVLSIPSCGV